MEVLSKSAEETNRLALRIAASLKEGDVLALYGELGSGKTTFVQGLVKALGSKDRVQSPTFILARHYSGSGAISKINHFDLYRVPERTEALNLGILESFGNAGVITVIEWPEVIEDLLPERRVKIEFKYAGEGERIINVQNLS